MNSIKALFYSILPVGIAIVCIASLVTHVVVCVAAEKAALLIAGLFFFPVGIIHGLGVLLGFW